MNTLTNTRKDLSKFLVAIIRNKLNCLLAISRDKNNKNCIYLYSNDFDTQRNSKNEAITYKQFNYDAKSETYTLKNQNNALMDIVQEQLKFNDVESKVYEMILEFYYYDEKKAHDTDFMRIASEYFKK